MKYSTLIFLLVASLVSCTKSKNSSKTLSIDASQASSDSSVKAKAKVRHYYLDNGKKVFLLEILSNYHELRDCSEDKVKEVIDDKSALIRQISPAHINREYANMTKLGDLSCDENEFGAWTSIDPYIYESDERDKYYFETGKPGEYYSFPRSDANCLKSMKDDIFKIPYFIEMSLDYYTSNPPETITEIALSCSEENKTESSITEGKLAIYNGRDAGINKLFTRGATFFVIAYEVEGKKASYLPIYKINGKYPIPASSCPEELKDQCFATREESAQAFEKLKKLFGIDQPRPLRISPEFVEEKKDYVFFDICVKEDKSQCTPAQHAAYTSPDADELSLIENTKIHSKKTLSGETFLRSELHPGSLADFYDCEGLLQENLNLKISADSPETKSKWFLNSKREVLAIDRNRVTTGNIFKCPKQKDSNTCHITLGSESGLSDDLLGRDIPLTTLIEKIESSSCTQKSKLKITLVDDTTVKIQGLLGSKTRIEPYTFREIIIDSKKSDKKPTLKFIEECSKSFRFDDNTGRRYNNPCSARYGHPLNGDRYIFSIENEQSISVENTHISYQAINLDKDTGEDVDSQSNFFAMPVYMFKAEESSSITLKNSQIGMQQQAQEKNFLEGVVVAENSSIYCFNCELDSEGSLWKEYNLKTVFLNNSKAIFYTKEEAHNKILGGGYGFLKSSGNSQVIVSGYSIDGNMELDSSSELYVHKSKIRGIEVKTENEIQKFPIFDIRNESTKAALRVVEVAGKSSLVEFDWLNSDVPMILFSGNEESHSEVRIHRSSNMILKNNEVLDLPTLETVKLCKGPGRIDTLRGRESCLPM